MKSFLQSLQIMALLIVATCGLCFSQTPEIVGLWRVDWSAMQTAMSPDESSRFSALPESSKIRAQDVFSSRIYSFASNGQFEVSWDGSSGRIVQSGVWSLHDNLLKIVLDNMDRDYTVSVEGNWLTLSMSSIPNGALFSKIVLLKK